MSNFLTIIYAPEMGGCSVKVREATKAGYAIASLYDCINVGQPNSKTRRGRVGRGVSNTLLCTDEMAVVVDD